MPFRAKAPFLHLFKLFEKVFGEFVSMPFRAKAPFLRTEVSGIGETCEGVSMPFRAKAPFLQAVRGLTAIKWW